MKIEVLQEAGFEWACLGLSYSYKDRKIAWRDWWNTERKAKAFDRAYKLHDKDGGHNKFLESVVVWLNIEATRSFWQEFDTYRTGMTKQSESTMHTLNKRRPEQGDFEIYTHPEIIEVFQKIWDDHKNDIMVLKESMPEGFLQSRIVCTNYKTVRSIVWQRHLHRYKWWRTLVEQLQGQLEHPGLIWPDLNPLTMKVES